LYSKVNFFLEIFTYFTILAIIHFVKYYYSMPHTFVHPGFLLWLTNKNKHVYFSAIVISSIVPDFDILFRLTDTRIHIFNSSFKDVFGIILPLSFCFWLFYYFFLNKIYSNLFTFINLEPELKIKDLIYVIFTMIFGIYVHLFLDLISHWNAFNLQMLIGANTGNLILSYFFYFYALYGNAILISFLGFYLTLRYFNITFSEFILLNKKINPNQIQFFKIFILSSIIFFIFKFSFAIKEKIFFIDIVIINLTSSIIFSLFFAPIAYKLLTKEKNIYESSK
jgi:hypothetical protein